MTNEEIKQLVAAEIAKVKSELETRLLSPGVKQDVESIVKTGVFDIKGLLRIIGGELHIGGGGAISGIEGGFNAPLVIFDDPGIVESKRASAVGVATTNRGLNTEQISSISVVETIGKLEPSDLSGNETPPLQSSKLVNLAEVLLTHATFDDSGYNSFFWGLRFPSLIGNGRIQIGGTVLIDLSQAWEVNELAGATLYLSGSTTEAYTIASNTANTITITGGTWISASNEYAYQVSRPVYLGAANGPWRRLYVQDDIRFGIGPSDGAYPASGKTVFRLIKESSRALSCEAAFGSKKQATTVGAGFTLTWTSGFHVLTGTAARTSDTTTAITNGAFAGQLLILEGTSDTNTITIKQNANTRLAGGADVVLGVNDILGLIWDGTDWLQIFTSNNS